ncbi:metallopeptidase family protein [Ktedonobacter sp. SOSP1-52]|nr:metallopeptidase family protein [Ktedonobacter sp. SOSP1-52]
MSTRQLRKVLGDLDRIRAQVRKTILHEVAHHFGVDHEEMPIWIQ